MDQVDEMSQATAKRIESPYDEDITPAQSLQAVVKAVPLEAPILVKPLGCYAGSQNGAALHVEHVGTVSF